MSDPTAEALDLLRATDAVGRLHDRDDTLFGDAPDIRDSVRTRLGWLDLAPPPRQAQQRVTAVADAVRADGFERVVLAGMGGSSLAPEVFAAIGPRAGGDGAGGDGPGGDGAGGAAGLPLQVLDSTHPDAVRAVLDDTDLARTLVVVASKSGGTEETACFAAHAATLLPSPTHLLAITDAGSDLERQAHAEGWRDTLVNPSDIGGRYSALSFFGMAAAALSGVDVQAVWSAAARAAQSCRAAAPLQDNPAAQLAAFMAGHAMSGRDKLTLLAGEDMAPLGDWIEQLVAESTGKQGTGVVPVVGEPLGEPYGDDRAFVVLGDPTGVDVPAGHPVFHLDEPDLGAQMLVWEVATALAGVVLGSNPFDEPNVTESKVNTKLVLAEGTPPPPENGDAEALLGQVRPGDYVSIQAYLPPTPALHAALRDLRVRVRARTGAATTVGIGPRFLHSTGQLHKGGPNTCVALQLADAPTGGPDIPSRGYDFATLVRAQAAGDLRSLRDHGRRVAQVRVDGAGAVERLLA